MKFSLMMKYAATAALITPVAIVNATDATINKTEIDQLNHRIEVLEQRLQSIDAATPIIGKNAFNPAISIILDGTYISYENNPEHYHLPGFALGGKAKLTAPGFSLGHSEIVFSSNIDSNFFGQFTIALDEHDGKTELKLEEAFFETLALGNGFTIRAGRFFSGIGYLNQQHKHAWDFHDAPLIYRGLFGNQYRDDGIRVSHVVASDLFLKFGAEVFSGNKFPAGGDHDDIGSWTAFANVGGDIDISHSWLAGLSYWRADNIDRDQGGHGHAHTHDSHAHDAHSDKIKASEFEGDSNIIGLNAVYKWAPGGNFRDQNFKLQFEYFIREDEGKVKVKDDGHYKSSSLTGEQDGWYLQAIWQLAPQWRVGARYDSLDSDNRGSDEEVLEKAGLMAHGFSPQRSSLMAEWLPSKFSRIRLQFNHDDSHQQADNQLFLQYTMSLGAHGAHTF